jgi:hypothetical protein
MVIVYYPASAYVALGIAKQGKIESEFERHVDTYRRLFACEKDAERLFHERYGGATVEDIVLETLSRIYRSPGDLIILQTVEVTTDIDIAKSEFKGAKKNYDGVIIGIEASAEEFAAFMHPCRSKHLASRKLEVNSVPEVHVQESARKMWESQIVKAFDKYGSKYFYF